ncbi:TadE family protein [Lederbergia citrea]|uniref:Pilus assembly protein n=1 Tax=Lederbergia citrea TaxID=2833581 RepID=A0A942UP42_9BACI|nr:TadE family protein [Lederbergia citrea]MBS4179491.1 pilus assembly protein [Lederbergia citrea]MBS4206159.1 pilus assembly protein [Lederbergia citrea]MBS4224905.1 pilus assembly protein [Lederbergia citrea]
MSSKKYIQNEEGSATIEFLGILPFILLVVVIMWQLIVSIHAVILVQSAANEAGKVYSLTKNRGEASAAAQEIISAGGSYLSFQSAPISGEKNYTATVNANIRFVFLPQKYFGAAPSYSFSSTAKGRVIE